MKLTLAKIKILPIGKKISDGQGLCLTKTAPNKGRWEHRYMINKRARVMALGTYPEIPLIKARHIHFEQRQLLVEGKDPLEQKHRREERQRRHATLRFSHMAEMCIAQQEHNWTNKKHAHDWRSSLRRLAYPLLDQKAFPDLTTHDIIAVLKPLWQTKRDTAKKLQGRIKIIFGFAIVGEYYKGANPALWQDHLERYFSRLPNHHKIQHLRSLPYTRLPKLYASLNRHSWMVAHLLHFNLLTVVRPSEARLARVEEFDLEGKRWEVPWQRMKNRLPHSVPLSDQAVALIETLRRQHNYPFVFHGRDPDKPLSDNAALVFLKRSFKSYDTTVHGFRASFRTWAAERVTDAFEVAELSLAHKIYNDTQAPYQRSSLFEKRRTLMQNWADFLSKNPTTTLEKTGGLV